MTGRGARPLTEGEYHSARAIDAVVPNMVPKAAGWGEYHNGESQVYFYLADFHDMDLSAPPEPASFVAHIAAMHQNGTSPNGMFGFSVPTVIGVLERTVTWEKSWAKSFTH